MKKALQMLSILLVLCTVLAGTVLFSQAAGTVCEEDFDGLTAGTVTKISGWSLASTGSKPGVQYEIVKDGTGGQYLRWIQGTSDPYIRPNWAAEDYAASDEDTMTFSVDLRMEADKPVIAGRMMLRVSSSDSSDNVSFFATDKTGMVYAGPSSTAGLPLIRLDADVFHTFSFVPTFDETPHMDVYVDGVLLASDVALTMPEGKVTGTNTEWFRSTTFFNMSSTKNSAGDATLLIDNIRAEGGDTMGMQAQTDARLLVLYANGGTVDRSVTYTPGMTLPEPVLEGAQFKGWYTDADFSGDSVTQVPDDAAGVQCFWARWNKPYTVTFRDGEKIVGTQSFSSDAGGFEIQTEQVPGCAWYDTASQMFYHTGAFVAADGDTVLEAIGVYGPFEDGNTLFIDNDYSGDSVVSSDCSVTEMTMASNTTVTIETEGENRFMQVQSPAGGNFYYDLRNVTGSRFTMHFSLRAAAGQPVAKGLVGYKWSGSTGPSLLTFDTDGTLKFLGEKVGMLTADAWTDFIITIDGEARTASLYIDGLAYAVDAEAYANTGVERPFYFFLNQSEETGFIQLDNLKIYQGEAFLAETADCRVNLLPGASVRTAAPTGLRFESTLDRAMYETLVGMGYSVTFGTYIFPADQYFTYEANGMQGALVSAFTDIGDLTYDPDTGLYTYYTSIVNLLDQNYARAFGAVSYITAERDGVSRTYTTPYSSEENARSIYQVAKAVLQDTEELQTLTDPQRAVITGYLDAVVELDGDGAVVIDNYNSPYTVVVADRVLTVTAGSEDQLTAIRAILYDGKVYTGGWTVKEDGIVVTLPVPDELIPDTERFSGMQSVLLMGQSNMAGRGDLSKALPVQDDRIYMMRDGAWVPMVEPIHEGSAAGACLGATFAKGFVDTFGNDIGLIPTAVGGTSIDDWTVGGELYNNALAMARAAQQTSSICAILWHQGESNMGNNADYAEKFNVIMTSLLNELGLDRNDVVIISGQLGEFKGSSANAINAQFERIGMYFPNYAVTSSKGLTAEDVTTHFDAASLRVFGYRYFANFYQLVTGKTYTDFSDDPDDYRVEVGDDLAAQSFDRFVAGEPFSRYGVITDIDGDGNMQCAVSGAGKYIDIANAEPIQGRGFVVEGLFRISADYAVSNDLLKPAYTDAEGNPKSLASVWVDTSGALWTASGGESLGVSLASDSWTHVAIVYHEDATRDIYINGTLAGEGVACTDFSGISIPKVRVIHNRSKADAGSLYVDDYQCYYGDAVRVPESNS